MSGMFPLQLRLHPLFVGVFTGGKNRYWLPVVYNDTIGTINRQHSHPLWWPFFRKWVFLSLQCNIIWRWENQCRCVEQERTTQEDSVFYMKGMCSLLIRERSCLMGSRNQTPVPMLFCRTWTILLRPRAPTVLHFRTRLHSLQLYWTTGTEL